MNWNSPAEFFAMGGYGLYVWGSYAVTVVLMSGRRYEVFDTADLGPHQRMWLVHNKTTGAITVQQWDEAANAPVWTPLRILGYG